jgi:hypothetical protein
VLCTIGAGIANADTVTLDAYRTRLRDARSLVFVARTAPNAQQATLLAQAADVLRSTDAIRLADGSTLTIDDTALASRLKGDDAALVRVLADLDARVAMADVALASHLTGAQVDDRLRSVTPAPPAPAANDPGLIGLFLGLVALVIAFVARGTLSAVDPVFVVAVVAGLGLAIALLVFGVLGRGVRERIRREALAADARVGTAEDPTAHLRRADAAIAAGRPRDALHELYLFALAMLAAHETIRFDPALTDRELLARAAAIPEIGALRALVALHERVWFGLKPASGEDAARARELAEQVAA